MSMNPNDPANPGVPDRGGSASRLGDPNAPKPSRSPLMVVVVLVIAVAVAVGAFFGVRALMSKDSKPTATVTPTAEAPTTDPTVDSTTPTDDFDYEELSGKKLEFQDYSVEFTAYADDVSNFVASHRRSQEVPAGMRPAAVHVRYTNLSDAPLSPLFETPIMGEDSSGMLLGVIHVVSDVFQEGDVRGRVEPGQSIEYWTIYLVPEDEHAIEFLLTELNDFSTSQRITIP